MDGRRRRSTLVALMAILLVQGSAAAQGLTIRVNLPAYRLDVYQGRISNDDALELAKLLAFETGARMGPSEISALERNSSRTRQVGVPARVRVEIVYILAEEIDGKVHVYEDVYGLGMTERERAISRRAR